MVASEDCVAHVEVCSDEARPLVVCICRHTLSDCVHQFLAVLRQGHVDPVVVVVGSDAEEEGVGSSDGSGESARAGVVTSANAGDDVTEPDHSSGTDIHQGFARTAGSAEGNCKIKG